MADVRDTKTKIALGAAMVLGTVAALVPALKFLGPISICARRVDKSNRTAPERLKIVLGIAMVLSTILNYLPLPWPWLKWASPVVAIAIDLIWLKDGE